jgi:hypothetical protein
MIGTIRKHSSWLWWVVAGLTIISFIWWGANPGTRNGGGRNGGLGVIYGKPISLEDFDLAKREFYIYYWRRTGEFPDHTGSLGPKDIERETYVRLLMTDKANQMGIHVSEEAQAAGALEFLKSLGRDGQTVPLNQFVEKILKPEGLTPADFQRFVVDDLIIDQLAQTLGLPGALVPPQEAGQLYDREHQEVSAQAVFFSGTNYLSQVAVTPAAVGMFYTNYMAHYRLPDRVQVNYLQFDLTNYLAAAEQKLGKTNIDATVDANYTQKGKELAPDAKTPAEAKAKIREMFLRQAAAGLAVEEAKSFLKELFAMDPVKADNLVTLAKKKGLPVHATAPFTEAEGPDEFAAPADLTKTAFKLNDDSPFSPKPIPGAESIYIIGLANKLPSDIPPLSEIHDRVMQDFQNHEAALKARAAGTNFYSNVAVQMVAGKTFAQAALASGQAPVALRPFSLSTQSMPDVEDYAQVNDIKNAAFSTQPGHVSPFEPTADGGFVLYVQSLLPVDEARRNVDLPKFLAQLRRSRENEAFNIWLQAEASRELRNTPIFDEVAGNKSARQ